MTDWKAIALAYALAYAEMREAFYIADHNNGDTTSAQHVTAAAKLIADIPTAAIIGNVSRKDRTMKKKLLSFVNSVISELWLRGILGDWAEEYLWSNPNKRKHNG